MEPDTFDAQICSGVVVGHCVIFSDATVQQKIIYAGPLSGPRPDVTGMLVLLNPTDFAKLKTKVDGGKH